MDGEIKNFPHFQIFVAFNDKTFWVLFPLMVQRQKTTCREMNIFEALCENFYYFNSWTYDILSYNIHIYNI